MLSNLGKKVITDLAIPLARDNLPGLVRNLASNAINEFERKISKKGAYGGPWGPNSFCKWFSFQKCISLSCSVWIWKLI